MKKVLVLVLAVVMVMSMAIPAAAEDTQLNSGTAALTKEAYALVKLFAPEEIQKQSDEEMQKRMTEAKETLNDACPQGFVNKFFFSVDLIGTEVSVSVDFEPIEHNEIVFKQYVDGAWVEREFIINDDRTITCYDVVEGPFAIFVDAVLKVSGVTVNGALPSPGAASGDLIPGMGEEDDISVIFHTLEDVVEKLFVSIQDLMAEAKEKLKDACPEGFAVKYFFYVEVIGTDDVVSVDFEPIDHNEIVFKKYVNGAWKEMRHTVEDDGTIAVYGVEEAPFAIFTK